MKDSKHNAGRAAMVRFWKKFLRLTRGRVTVLRALDVITQEEKDPVYKNLVASLKRTVEKGSPLSVAAGEYPEHFSKSVIELLMTAEQTGAWDEILPEIAEGIEDGTFD